MFSIIYIVYFTLHIAFFDYMRWVLRRLRWHIERITIMDNKFWTPNVVVQILMLLLLAYIAFSGYLGNLATKDDITESEKRLSSQIQSLSDSIKTIQANHTAHLQHHLVTK